MKFTKFISGLLVIVCVFAMAGCGVSENGASKNRVDNNTASTSDSKKSDSTANDSEDTNTPNGTDNTDGDSLIRSSTLQGSVVEFSDGGCTVTPVTNEDEDTAVVAAPGNENDETNVTISYKTDCIFQKANISITTGKASISDAFVSDIKKQTSLLIYGDFEDTYHLTAEKVIIVYFE